MPNNVPSCVVVHGDEPAAVLVEEEEEEEGKASSIFAVDNSNVHCRRDDEYRDDYDTATISSCTSSSSSSSSSSSGTSSCSKDKDEQSIATTKEHSAVVVAEPPLAKNIQEHQPKEEHFQVVIVGAGAAGLQCAHTLIHDHGLQPSDVVILEARNRVGGRICSITTQDVPGGSSSNDSSSVASGATTSGFTRDLGAAWVHGTRLNAMNNPVLDLLRQSAENRRKQSDSSPTTTNENENEIDDDDDDRILTTAGIQNDPLLRDLIQPVMPGNPWMRPKTILNDNAGIALYVQPSQQQPQQESLESSSSSSSRMAPQHEIIQDALSQHFKILQDVSKKVAAMYSHGDGMDTIQCSIGRYLQEETMKSHQQQAMSVSQQEQGEEASDSNRIQRQNTTVALTGFYQHLLTCWYGRSLFDLQLGYFDNGTDDTTAMDSSMNGDEKANDDASFVEYGDFAGPHCTVRNGMHQVLEPLLQEHDLERNCIRLEQVVTSIHPSCNDSSGAHSTGGDVVVETANGRCVYGKTCVVTLPLGCLRQQEQSHNDDDDVSTNHLNNNIFAKTPLSVEKRIAIQHMNMGAYKKVFLTFDRCFWDTKPAFLGLVLMHDDDDDVDDVRIQKKNPLGKYLLLNNLWATTTGRSNTAPCLEAILAGDQGTWATGKSDDVIQSAVLDFMQRAMMPTSSSSDKDDEQIIIQDWCTSCHVTRWEEDVYSRGAYSSWSRGALPRHRTELSRPEWNERLYFAGEATHDGFEGSVHAALLSGTHAASSVAKHLVCAAGLAMTKEAETATNSTAPMQLDETGQKLH